MERAREYFARFGAMTITVARFVPIVCARWRLRGRPVADAARAAAYNGRRRRLVQLDDAGRLLAGLDPWVRANLHWVSVIIIGLSLIPVALQWLQVTPGAAARRQAPGWRTRRCGVRRRQPSMK